MASPFGVWLSIPVLVVAIWAQGMDTWFNFGQTLSWTPGTVQECDTVDCVRTAILNAKNNGQHVKGFGVGWSWSTTIAGDGDMYIVLRGALADASTTQFDLTATAPTAVVNGGVQAFHLYMELQSTGFNIEAKGGCLTARESQTIGGLLATNVHHTGIKSFYDVVEWIDVVTADGELQRTFRDETLFRLTIGGGGRTGIIVGAQFHLAPRATYGTAQNLPQPEDASMKAFFEGFVHLNSGYKPNEFIGEGVALPNSVASFVRPFFLGKIRMAEPSDNPVILNPGFGDLSVAAKIFLVIDAIMDPILPPIAYDLFYASGLYTILTGAAPESRGKTGEDLDVACSGSNTPHLKHQQLEFFVPVGLMGAVGAYLDIRFAQGAFSHIRNHSPFYLRFVYGCNSLTAPNGVLFDGSSADVVAVNIDSFQRSTWAQYNRELNEMMAELAEQFPRQIRTHPGKYNPPLSPDPESPTVKELLESYDPDGVFARDTYVSRYLTRPP